MTRAELLALADRAKVADGADRELDADILHRLYSTGWQPSREHVAYPGYQFTASVDAALMLVGEGRRARVDINEDGSGAAWVWVPGETPELTADKCATPALAIVAASLRALAGECGE